MLPIYCYRWRWNNNLPHQSSGQSCWPKNSWRLWGRLHSTKALLGLIERIQYNSQLGTATNGIEQLRGIRHPHFCVEINRGFFGRSFAVITSILHEANSADRFRQGASAAVAEKILSTAMMMLPEGQHNFGHGLYCFQENCGNSFFTVSKVIVNGRNPWVEVFRDHNQNLERLILDVSSRKIKGSTLKKTDNNDKEVRTMCTSSGRLVRRDLEGWSSLSLEDFCVYANSLVLYWLQTA